MTGKQFDMVVECRLLRIRGTLQKKNAEYAPGADKLHNFKAGAKLQRCTPEKALLGYLTKHLVSIFDLVENLGRGKCASLDVWREKIGDAINYLILLEALIDERILGPEDVSIPVPTVRRDRDDLPPQPDRHHA
ncbi:MAG: hypothetical protein C4529_15005 [Deltaproteobacteria bacterium]|nr:MAG: hypothetical protein C4529_15005 [Deltaproteobacteria bacterium]